MDLPEFEEGAELTVLAVAERFNESIRLVELNWEVELKLWKELTLERLNLEALGVTELDRDREPSS